MSSDQPVPIRKSLCCLQFPRDWWRVKAIFWDAIRGLAKRVGAVATVVWPGLTHLLFGRIWIGLVLSFGFSLVMLLAVVHTWVEWDSDPSIRMGLWGVGASVWLVNALWAWWRFARANPAEARQQTDQLLREAQEHQLKGDFAAAIAALERLLARVDTDCDAMVYLAGLYERQDQTQRAVRLWRRCRVEDWDDKWKWEAETAIGRLKSKGSRIKAEG